MADLEGAVGQDVVARGDPLLDRAAAGIALASGDEEGPGRVNGMAAAPEPCSATRSPAAKRPAVCRAL